MIELHHCRVEFEADCVRTIFPDNAVSYNHAPIDRDFERVAIECGFVNNRIGYVQQHDLAHAFLAEKMFDKPSPVLWAAAHQKPVFGEYEERWVYHWQRFVNGIAGPLEYCWPDWVFHWGALG